MARFGGQPFTPHEDALVDRMVADGWPFNRIADALGRSSGASVRHRYLKVQAAKQAAAYAASRASRAKHRHCGRCGARFWSEHAGVRRCDPCRDVSDSPYEPEHDCGTDLLPQFDRLSRAEYAPRPVRRGRSKARDVFVNGKQPDLCQIAERTE